MTSWKNADDKIVVWTALGVLRRSFLLFIFVFFVFSFFPQLLYALDVNPVWSDIPKQMGSTLLGADKANPNNNTFDTTLMYDDGTHGDSVAGDGLWSIRVEKLFPNITYDYKFLFDSATLGGQKYELNGLANRNLVIPSTADSPFYVQKNWSDSPDMPQNVKVQPDTGKITISWEASFEYDVLGYEIQRDTNTAFTSIDFTDSLITGGTTLLGGVSPGVTLSYTDTNVVNGVKYYYRVRAFDAYIQTRMVSTYTSAVLGIAGNTELITFQVDVGDFNPGASGPIRLGIDAVDFDPGVAMTDIGGGTWTVQVPLFLSSFVEYKFFFGTGGSGTFEKLVGGANRKIQIMDTQTLLSNWGDTPDFSNVGAPTAVAGNSVISLSWTKVDEDVIGPGGGYNIYRAKNNSAGPYTQIATLVNATSYSDTTVTTGDTFYYKLEPRDSTRNQSLGPQSSPFSATAVSSIPVIFQVDMGNISTLAGVVMGSDDIPGVSFSPPAALSRVGSTNKFQLSTILPQGQKITYKYGYQKGTSLIFEKPSSKSRPMTFSFPDSSGVNSVSVVYDDNNFDTNENMMVKEADNIWRTTIFNISTKPHIYKLVLDGSNFITDPNNPYKVSDGLGGFNSLFGVDAFPDNSFLRAVTIPFDTSVLIQETWEDTPFAPPFFLASPSDSTSVQLSWQSITDIKLPEVEDAAGYSVLRATNPADTNGFQVIATLSNPALTGYEDKNLTIGQKYYYQVKSMDGAGVIGEGSPLGIATPSPEAIIINGIVEASFGPPVAQDTIPEAQPSGFEIADLDRLWLSQDEANYYIAFSIRGDIDAKDFGFYSLLIDVDSDAGGAPAIPGRPITIATAPGETNKHFPDYAINFTSPSATVVTIQRYDPILKSFKDIGQLGSKAVAHTVNKGLSTVEGGVLSVVEAVVPRSWIGKPKRIFVEGYSSGNNADAALDTLNKLIGDADNNEANSTNFGANSLIFVSTPFPPPPKAPSGLTVLVDDTTVTLSWVDQNPPGQIFEFEIFLDSTTAVSPSQFSFDTTSQTFFAVFSGLILGESYSARVRAKLEDGSASAMSSILTFPTPTVPVDTMTVFRFDGGVELQIPSGAPDFLPFFPMILNFDEMNVRSLSSFMVTQALDETKIADQKIQFDPSGQLISRDVYPDTFSGIHQILILDKNKQEVPVGFFTQPVTLVMGYADVDPADGLLDNLPSLKEDGIGIFKLDRTKLEWAKQSGASVDKVKNRVSITTKDFSVWTEIAQPTPLSDFSKILLWPNPYNEQDFLSSPISDASILSRPGIYFDFLPIGTEKIIIYNIAGEKVRTLDSSDPREIFPPTVVATGIQLRGYWDARNDYGRKVASGIYIYFARRSNGATKTGKMAVIK